MSLKKNPSPAVSHPDLADELIIVRNSGEIPEVALHGSLYYLTADPEGPGLTLDEETICRLKLMALQRYREILLRDLTHGNRNKSCYRGLARCIANWQRTRRFCQKEGLDILGIKTEVGEALEDFLAAEIEALEDGRRSSINCEIPELFEFIKEFDLPLAEPAEQLAGRLLTALR